jgi:hypothetical protein
MNQGRRAAALGQVLVLTTSVVSIIGNHHRAGFAGRRYRARPAGHGQRT